MLVKGMFCVWTFSTVTNLASLLSICDWSWKHSISAKTTLIFETYQIELATSNIVMNVRLQKDITPAIYSDTMRHLSVPDMFYNDRTWRCMQLHISGFHFIFHPWPITGFTWMTQHYRSNSLWIKATYCVTPALHWLYTALCITANNWLQPQSATMERNRKYHKVRHCHPCKRCKAHKTC